MSKLREINVRHMYVRLEQLTYLIDIGFKKYCSKTELKKKINVWQSFI